MTSQGVDEDLIRLAERAVEALRRARSVVSNAETSKDVSDNSLPEGQRPDPTRETDSQLMPPAEVPYTFREKFHSSMASSETDYEAFRHRFFHLRANVNDSPGPVAVESVNDVTQTQRKPTNPNSFAPLRSHGVRPGLLRNAYEANGTSETQCNIDGNSGRPVDQNSFVSSWNARKTEGFSTSSSKCNVSSSTPSRLGPFTFKRNSEDSTGFPRYPFDGNSSRPAPLPLGPRVESAYTIDDASRSSQNGAEIQEQTRFVIKDGKYVSPEYMKGVPEIKIEEGGQYWRQSWPTIEQWIKGSKEVWVKDTVKFWKTYRIHPNQLISIDYYDELGLCSAATPRILQQTLEDLEVAGVPDPVQWLRKRLGELIVQNSKDFDKNFPLKAVLKRFRVHDSAFRPYYRKSKTRHNNAQPTSSKRAHVECLELSPRPQKKNVYSTSSDHATVSRLPQNDQIMPEQSPIISEIQKQNYSEQSVDDASGSRKEIISGNDRKYSDQPQKNLMFDVQFISCGFQRLEGDTSRMHFDARTEKIQPMDLEQKELLGHKYQALTISITTVASLHVVEENIIDINRFRESRMTVGFRSTEECLRFIAIICRCNERVRLMGVDRAQVERMMCSFC